MVTLSIILALAFTWLLFETDWLRIRLPLGKAILIDWYDEFDAYADSEFGADIDNVEVWDADKPYRDWLAKRYEVKLKYGYGTVDNIVDSRYKWMAEEEDLKARRNGEMIYQRGGAQGYNQLSRRQRELVGL